MQNMSLKTFDNQLKLIEIFNLYPAMIPYVGHHYQSSNHKKLLVVGESYYFPDESIIHKDNEVWYRSNQKNLNQEEVNYIDCRGLIECDWKSDGHVMYRNINNCINEIVEEKEDRAISNIAYCNAFFRPASTPGSSFKYCCETVDVKIAKETLSKIISVLLPEIVIFASRYAWNSVGKNIEPPKKHNCILDFTCHPTAHFYWNNKEYDYGRNKFMQILNNEFKNI